MANDYHKTWETKASYYKFNDPDNLIASKLKSGEISVDEAASTYAGSFIGKEEHFGNMACINGLKSILYYLVNGTGSVGVPTAPANNYSNANAYIGVGDSATAAAQAQTGLQAASNKAYSGMDTGYPACSTVTPWTITFQSTFGSAEANFAWQEYGVFGSNTGTNMLNRYVVSKGTKASGETWVLQIVITFS